MIMDDELACQSYHVLNEYFSSNPSDGHVRSGENLARYTSMGCGGRADFFCDVYSYQGLRTIIRFCLENDIPYRLLGYGTDILVSDKGVRGVVIRLMGDVFWSVKELGGNRLRVGSRVGLRKIIAVTTSLGLSGAEWLMGIPASLGGAVSLNAGAYGRRIADIIEDVTVYIPSDDTKKTFNRDELLFEYRRGPFYNNEIILEATLKFEPGKPEDIRAKSEAIIRTRKQKLPEGKSAGCVFKNPQQISAGALIEMAGLKGRTLSGAMVSERHANIVINKEHAHSDDIITLIKEIQDTVERSQGIHLDLEIKIWS
ncbi:MAG: UDP-N-acetylmuramate dehydrogenase [Candidatus Auribacter fodinae]|jgi:UDP-N-acetylmuramate dehydrogenase|uniref:UDP-N-acetylenolpyruvoylglucosamine reductase n=1 Tax=Candidatus Auribacter fodinae TaxID=2093366 RepID=A0A3A4RIN7_9BACT|nr:MAG: UDP-N-acetylmuramate dehydrogenase [Candidatus Auribacter fodinae]